MLICVILDWTLNTCMLESLRRSFFSGCIKFLSSLAHYTSSWWQHEFWGSWKVMKISGYSSWDSWAGNSGFCGKTFCRNYVAICCHSGFPGSASSGSMWDPCGIHVGPAPSGVFCQASGITIMMTSAKSRVPAPCTSVHRDAMVMSWLMTCHGNVMTTRPWWPCCATDFRVEQYHWSQPSPMSDRVRSFWFWYGLICFDMLWWLPAWSTKTRTAAITYLDDLPAANNSSTTLSKRAESLPMSSSTGKKA